MNTSTGSATSNKRLAAIDVGSNSVRLLVAEVASDGSSRILDDEKETTRLARGLAGSGVLSEESIQQTLEALRRMKVIAEGYAVERLEIIATSAVREAANRESFLELIRERLGLEVEVIPASDEGRLSFNSVAQHFDLRANDAAIVDLGGGSAELVLVAKGVVEDIYSLPLGAVRLTESFVQSDPLSEHDFFQLKKHIRKQFDQTVGKLNFQPHIMIGAGGTFTTLAQIAMRRLGQSYSSVSGYELNRGEVRHILCSLRDLPLRARRNVPGLNPDRADIIIAGIAVIERLMKLLHINRVWIHDQGVRDGLLLRMISRVFPKRKTVDDETDPLSGVRQFATACMVEQKHAEQVASLARQMFDQLQEPLQLASSDRLILEAAALLHEVGNLINYERHHHHSYHLIMHGNLRGLSPRQRELAANVARYHRRSAPKSKHANFRCLSPLDRETVRRLSAILRVADGLDRTHMQRIQSVRCEKRSGLLIITASSTQMPDVDLWGAHQKGKLFEKVFHVKLSFGWQPTLGEAGGASMGSKKRHKQMR